MSNNSNEIKDKKGKDSIDDNKTKSKAKITWSIFGWIVFAVLILFVVVKVVDKFTDYTWNIITTRSCVISSGSMSTIDKSNQERLEGHNDQLQKGDLIYYSTYKEYDDIQINDVVVYYNGSTLITHRVVEKIQKDGSDYVITQGDANNVIDGLIPYSWLRGKVVGKIPKIGYVTLYLVSPYGLLAISSIVLIIILWAIANEIIKNKDKRNVVSNDINLSLEERIIAIRESNKNSNTMIISVSKNVLLTKDCLINNASIEEDKKELKENLS